MEDVDTPSAAHNLRHRVTSNGHKSPHDDSLRTDISENMTDSSGSDSPSGKRCYEIENYVNLFFDFFVLSWYQVIVIGLVIVNFKLYILVTCITTRRWKNFCIT